MNENNQMVLDFQNHYDMLYRNYKDGMYAEGAISEKTNDLIHNEGNPFEVLVSIPNDKHDLSHDFWKCLTMRYSKEYMDLVYPNHTKPYEDRNADDDYDGLYLPKTEPLWMVLRGMLIENGGIIVEDHDDHSFFLCNKDVIRNKDMMRRIHG